MNWYEVLLAVEKHKSAVQDISTGDPFLLPEVTIELIHSIERMARDHRVGEELGAYAYLDGLPDLIGVFENYCSQSFGYEVDQSRITVTPGGQAALRYIQQIVREQGFRILYPVGLEFPGAIDQLSPHEPSLGRYSSSESGQYLCRPFFDLSDLDWQGVGAVVLSRPHNPTGRLWTSDEIISLASSASHNNALLVLDETYALPFAPLTTERNLLVDAPNIVHLYSFSKVGLASERVGVAVASPEITKKLRGVLRKNIIQPPKLGQRLAISIVDYFGKNPDIALRYGTLYRERWESCFTELMNAGVLGQRIRASQWEGGPFLWLEWHNAPSSDAVFWRLLEAGVAVAPGSALQIAANRSKASEIMAIRIGLGASTETLTKGIRITAQVLSELDKIGEI